MNRAVIFLILCGTVLTFANAVDSQELPPQNLVPQEENPAFTISRQVDEVNLVLSVTDSRGRFVNNLTADDLQLLDNHKPPERWNYFQARTDLPLRVVLAVDISSSVRDRFRFEQQAASSFLKRILRKETDEAAVVAFGDRVQEKTQGMTNDADQLNATINALQPGGETALYDALVLASRKLREVRGKSIVRPVIILITDGEDTASKASLRNAEEAATRAEAVIFALDANVLWQKQPKGRIVLEKLTAATGGFVLPAREKSDLKSAFVTVEKVLRSQYALGYPPPELEANGSFRSIQITARRRGLKVHARDGYYAPVANPGSTQRMAKPAVH